MNQKWQDLPSETRLQFIRDTPEEVLKATYDLGDTEIRTAKKTLETFPRLKPHTKLLSVSAAPDKRSLREASRDFTMTLTFAELIDNSIDRFLKNNPTETDTLQIAITFDRLMNVCVYEDNAGGIKEGDIQNLFKPGGTDNDPLGWSIGSYAWGAKKARSALADSVDIISRPGSGPTCFATIDKEWDSRDADWLIQVGEEGKNFELPRQAKVPPGCTRFMYKNLKPLVETSPVALSALRKDLGELYALILAHHPDSYKFNVEITVDGEQVSGSYEYRWTGYRDLTADLHPRKYSFSTEVLLPFVSDEGSKRQKVDFILEIGVKQDTGCATEGVDESGFFDTTDDWGIDVYGLGLRLIERNLRSQLGLTQELVQKQASAKLVKGRLIIKGSSYAIPWDTHKTKVAVGHPTLLAINEKIGPVVQEYVRVARKAGRGLQQAVSQFKQTPWDGKWEAKDAAGHKVPFSFTEATGISILFNGGESSSEEAENINEENTALDNAPTTPGSEEQTTSQPQAVSAQAPRVANRTQVDDGRSQSPENYFPKMSSSHSPTRSSPQKNVKFQVTEQEHQMLCRWLKCDGKEVSEKLKKKVLREAKAGSPNGRPSSGGIINNREFRNLREKIRDPELLSYLQASRLSSVTVIRHAGKEGLRKVGLSNTQIDAVMKAIGE